MINHEDNNDWLISLQIDKETVNKIKKDIDNTIKKLKPENLERLSTRGELSKQYALMNNIDENLVNQIKQLIISKYKELFDVKDIKLETVGAWTVLADKGGWHAMHDHITGKEKDNDYIGVIIYLESPEPTFNEPGKFYYVYEDKPTNYIKYNEVDIKKGTMIIIPSWLMHGAYPCSGKRQSLNFEFDLTEL